MASLMPEYSNRLVASFQASFDCEGPFGVEFFLWRLERFALPMSCPVHSAALDPLNRFGVSSDRFFLRREPLAINFSTIAVEHCCFKNERWSIALAVIQTHQEGTYSVPILDIYSDL
jgi:hypothetical protein